MFLSFTSSIRVSVGLEAMLGVLVLSCRAYGGLRVWAWPVSYIMQRSEATHDSGYAYEEASTLK